MKLLFTNSGRRTYMVNYAKDISNTKIYLTDTNNHVPTFFQKGITKFITCKVKNNEKKYLSQLIKYVKNSKINIIIPLSDHDLILLSKNKNLFAKLGCKVIISNVDFIKNCLSKKKMYFNCKKNNINVPISFFSKNKVKFPLIKKKIFGSGSEGIQHINNKKELKNIDFKNFFLQKKITGTEFGIDIFNDPNKFFFRICIKKKILMRSGETDRSILVEDKKIYNFAKKILNTFNHNGNLDCDIIKDKRGKLFLIDINPRFGGGYPSTHLGGFNFLKYLLTQGKYNMPKKYNKINVSKGISVYKKSNLNSK